MFHPTVKKDRPGLDPEPGADSFRHGQEVTLSGANKGIDKLEDNQMAAVIQDVFAACLRSEWGSDRKFSITPGCIRKIPLNPPLQRGAVGMPGLIEMLRRTNLTI